MEHRVWTSESIVDLCNIADIDFVVVDAINCLEIHKNASVENQVRFNTILAGADAVAVDHVSAKLMGLNPDDVAHITLAEKAGLGTNDPEHIVLAGVPLEQAMKRVKKSQHADGKFGQSNRTWILSRHFEGTDMSRAYFVDEASIEPIPGEDEWSQPVYFFDDRIDLLSYYQGQAGITYAFSYFNAEKTQEAELWLGTHEGIQVFLNGELVYQSNTVNAFGDSDRLTARPLVHIIEGRNTLLVKTVNNFGDYSFTLNICELENDPYYFGNRVSGLKFYIDNSGTGSTITGLLEKRTSHQTTSLESYPNPAKDYVNIRFELGKSQQCTVQIYDLNGRIIKSFGREFRSPGIHELTWNLENNLGSRVSSGTYLCTLKAGNQSWSIKLFLE